MVLSHVMSCIEHDAKAQVTQAVDLQGHIAQAQIKVLLGELEQLVGLNYGSQLVCFLHATNKASTALHMWSSLNGRPLQRPKQGTKLGLVMFIHLIFCRAALVNGHWFDLVPVAFLVDRPGMIFSFELHTTVFQHLLVVLPGSEVEDFFQFAFSFNIGGRRFIASSQHVIHMEDENTNQFRKSPSKTFSS